MIEFHYETDFKLKHEIKFADWVSRVITSENCYPNQIDYIFCDDAYMLGLNQKYLSHDTYTDIITFDYSQAVQISGDIFISIDRVKENASNLEVSFEEEVLRVMSHGVLHLMGYDDKSKQNRAHMREKENEKIRMFHVEH